MKALLLRELHLMTSRRIYIGAAVVLPLFLIGFMATIFGSGQMEYIPVGVVDADNTAASREVVRSVSAVPTFDVCRPYADDASAYTATFLSLPTSRRIWCVAMGLRSTTTTTMPYWQ